MMRKTKIFIYMTALLLIIVGCGNDSANMKAYPSIPKKNQYRTIDYEIATQSLKDSEDGIYVIAHPGTYESHKLIPAMNEVLKDVGREAIYIDMSNEESYSTNISRRISDYIQSSELETNIQNFRPLIISIDGGEMKVFSPSDTEVNLNTQDITDDDYKTLQTDLKKSIFNN